MATHSTITPAGPAHIAALERDLLANHALGEVLSARTDAGTEEWDAWDTGGCAILKKIEELDAADPAACRLKALAIMTIYGTDPELLGDGKTTDMRLARQIIRALVGPWPVASDAPAVTPKAASAGLEAAGNRHPALA